MTSIEWLTPLFVVANTCITCKAVQSQNFHTFPFPFLKKKKKSREWLLKNPFEAKSWILTPIHISDADTCLDIDKWITLETWKQKSGLCFLGGNNSRKTCAPPEYGNKWQGILWEACHPSGSSTKSHRKDKNVISGTMGIPYVDSGCTLLKVNTEVMPRDTIWSKRTLSKEIYR